MIGLVVAASGSAMLAIALQVVRAKAKRRRRDDGATDAT
jgi:hypothetical protein